MTDKIYKVVSLFSGGMGLDLGLDSTKRFVILACVEKDSSCCETIRLNRDQGRVNKDMRIYEGDICDINPKQVMEDLGIEPGEIDLIVGGPPCQAFSTAGKRASVADPRGTLLWQYLHFIEVMQPKFFLMENVRGLVSAALKHRPIKERPEKGGSPLSEEEEPGSVIRKFCEDLQASTGAAYHMDCFEVNSVNYGAPQIRERALFIGNKYGVQVDFPNPTHGLENKESQKSQGGLFNEPPALLPWNSLRGAIGDLNEDQPEIMDFSARKKSFLKHVPEGANWRSLPVEMQQESMGKAWFAKGGRSGWWRRLTYDLPSPTLVTMPNHASTALCHPIETRALSVREYARIQEFPDSWEFSGKTSDKYKQIGNAVPIRLGAVAGTVVANALAALESGRKLEKAPVKYRIVYIQSHVRTRSWFKEGKTVVWGSDTKESARYSPSKTLRKVKAI